MRFVCSNQFFTCLLLLFLLIGTGCSGESDRDRLHALMDKAEEYEETQNPFRDSDSSDNTPATLWAESLDDLEAEYEFWVGMSV